MAAALEERVTGRGCDDDTNPWEPVSPSEQDPDLEEIQKRIEEVTAELRQRGKVLSGKTILACHTLPYTCCLVPQPNQDDFTSDTTVEIRESKSDARPIPLHSTNSPSTVSEELREYAKHLPAHLQPAALNNHPATPKSILINPMEELRISSINGKHHSNGNGPRSPSGRPFFDRSTSNDTSRAPSANGFHSPSNKQRWILTPRRGHAALNAGIRSLASTGEVTLVAWPGDMRHGVDDRPEEEDLGDLRVDDLSTALRAELDKGLNEIGGQGKGVRCSAVWLEDKLATDFYDGMCKGFLWPVFHYFALSDHVDKAKEATAWNAYVEANKRYAKAILDTYEEGDLIWIHDYHLMLVPGMLREKLPDAAIGFFLHSPFPSSELFRCLPRREAILTGLLGANLCCFQTYSYGRHFLSSCVRVMGYEISSEGHVDHKGNVTQIANCPIGIDAERIEKDRTKPGVQPKIKALRDLYKGKKIIVGRDKLDPTKGVLPKLQAFERLLDEYPEWIGKVVMIQVTSPSPTDSPSLSSKVSQMVDHINGKYGSLHFQPLHHYHQTVDRDEYFALLSAADLALVTSVRDGMNTTSMEYTICQKETKNPLILSEYCGIASSMKSAIRINPWDLGDCARAIDLGLNMSQKEKAERHENLYKRVVTHTSSVWMHQLLLRLISTRMRIETSHHVPYLNLEQVKESFKAADRRLLCFDYDGTLTPIVKVPSAATPSPQLLRVLEALAADERNIVYLISGRDAPFLMQHLGHIKNLGFSAEHGGFLREPGSDKWTNLTAGIDMSWRADVEDIFRYYEARTTGSQVEIKTAAITFHHRNADPLWGEFQAKECQAILESMQSRLPIDVMVGKRNLEVRPAGINKGGVVQRLACKHADAGMLICAGDDKTDEDMFRSLAQVQAIISGEVSMSSSPLVQAHELFNPAASGTVVSKEEFKAEHSQLSPHSIFSIVVDPAAATSRRTLAKYHVNEPQNIVDMLEALL